MPIVQSRNYFDMLVCLVATLYPLPLLESSAICPIIIAEMLSPRFSSWEPTHHSLHDIAVYRVVLLDAEERLRCFLILVRDLTQEGL